jgi:ribose transport system substrate-binding protein
VFWQSIHAGAEKAAQETGIEVMWNGPVSESDYAGQLQIVEAMINRHVDAIALSPIDRRALVGVVERAVRERIPVIIFDSPIDTEVYLARVATDNYQAGRLAAKRMGVTLGGQGTVGVVAVKPGGASSMLREQGFEDGIREEFPRIAIVDKRYGLADFAKSMEVTENMLTAHPSLNALFGSNESSTVGAARALRSRKSTSVKLVGFDSSPSLLEDLQSGLIDALVVQDPFRMGYEAVQTAVRKFRGEAVQKVNDLPATLVTKDNVNDPAVKRLLNPDLKKYLGG